MLIKKILFIAVFTASITGLKAQTVLSENDAVAKALKNSKNAEAALLNIQQQKQLLKSAINLPNPQFLLQSPSGQRYAGGVTQSLEFPLVYAKQYQLQNQQVGLAQTQKSLTDVQIAYQVRSLYLNIQYIDSLSGQLYIQDTIYRKLASSAQRQFDAGQIDYLQKTFVETQYGEVHNQYEQSKLNYSALINQLRYIAGINDSTRVEPLVEYKSLNRTDTSPGLLSENLELGVFRQIENISQKNLELQRSKVLPGLSFGYMNPAERNTPTRLRFQFGLSFPLWFWQYKGNINAARTELAANQQRTAGLQQQLTVQLLQAQNELSVNNQSLSYYQNIGLKKSSEIITTSKRFLTSGETDYINYLRNINDAYVIKQKYLDALKNVNQSIITINYLSGKL